MFEFEWVVPSGGFQWANRKPYPDLKTFTQGASKRFLVPVSSSAPPRIYQVFSRSALFRTFADIHVTEEGILEFANQYGLLGGEEYSVKISEPDPTKENTFWPGVGNRYIDWVKEIALMRHVVVDLLDNIRAGYAANLRKFIRWQPYAGGGLRVLYSGPQLPGWKGLSRIIADQSDDRTLFPSLRKGDTIRPAWLATLWIVNTQLERHPVHMVLRDNPIPEAPAASLTVPPASFIAALWTQLGRAIADNPETKQCEECNAYFEITTEKRSDARFCSDKCRVRAHRKKPARKLNSERG